MFFLISWLAVVTSATTAADYLAFLATDRRGRNSANHRRPLGSSIKLYRRNRPPFADGALQPEFGKANLRP